MRARKGSFQTAYLGRDHRSPARTQTGAIETSYRGRRYRSRTEARWAVFFDTLGVDFDFEPQGFKTPAGAYLPDFFLPGVSPYGKRGGCWFEVKPREYPLPAHPVDFDRWSSVALETNIPLVLAHGMQDPRVWRTGKLDTDRDLLTAFVPLLDETDAETGEQEYFLWTGTTSMWAICPSCNRISIEWAGMGNRVCRHGRTISSDSRVGAGTLHPRIITAYETALGARFEFGESG